MKKIRLQVWVALAIGSLLVSCAHVGDRWLVGTDAFAAQDQIMLIRKTPPSFGYRRLMSQTQVHTDLGVFLQLRGNPDFLAETGTKDRHYFILYYLGKREAFACRTLSRYSREVEFTGPYPITQREYELLHGIQKRGSHKIPNRAATGS
ncbi:MAG: hypothetical protein QM627_10475 [Luteolibacter sp.]